MSWFHYHWECGICQNYHQFATQPKGQKKAQQNLLRFPILDELKKACEPFRFINDFFPAPCFCCFPADCPKTWSHCLFCLEWLFWKPMILGIGLAIAKKIVENHNGLISATGEWTRGQPLMFTSQSITAELHFG